MARLAILAEGLTEHDFINNILAPHLQKFGVWVANPVDMGGNISLARLEKSLPPLLYSHDYVTTLVDYYGFKKDQRQEWSSVEVLETHIQKLADPSRFIAYVQQYEFEALLFSSPEKISAALRKPEKAAELIAIPAGFDSPEAINDSPETCPSARLNRIFGRFYNKVVHGPEIAAEIGLERMRERCPRFDCWLSRLEELGCANNS